MITIDYQDRRPIYEQIVERLQLLIVRGILEGDSQLPSVRQMASDLSLNPNTIQKAYAILEKDGYIYSVKGRGNFVSANKDLAEGKKRAWLNELDACLKKGRELGATAEDVSAAAAAVFGTAGSAQATEGRTSVQTEPAGKMTGDKEVTL